MDALLRVQAHRGLVKDQKRRVAQQGLGNAHPLALAAGEGADLGFAFSSRLTAWIVFWIAALGFAIPLSAAM